MKNNATITVSDNGNLHIHVPMFIKKMQGRKIVFAPKTLEGDNENVPELAQNAIVQALGRAFSWSERLESGEVTTISDLAKSLAVDYSYVTRILKLNTLAPDIIETLLNGEEPSGLSLAKLVKTFPENWEEQRKWFGFCEG